MTEQDEINSSTNEPEEQDEINSSTNEPEEQDEINSSTNEPEEQDEINSSTNKPEEQDEINSSTNEPEEQDEINSSTNESDLAFVTPEKQKARAFLRERFLRAITGFIGKPTEFYLHENTHVSGEFRGCDVECSKIFVRNLETPMGTIPEAILRNSDIICLDIDNINIEQ